MKRLDQENKNTVSEDHAEKTWKGIKIQTGNEKKKNGEKQAGRLCWVGFKEKRGKKNTQVFCVITKIHTKVYNIL